MLFKLNNIAYPYSINQGPHRTLIFENTLQSVLKILTVFIHDLKFLNHCL